MQNNPLNNIKIASPCGANWDAMLGDERKRFCGECKLNVYNLSGMTTVEAEKLLVETEGRLCVRFYKRADGTILTQDCPVGWAKIERNLSRAATAAFALVFGLLGGVFSLSFFKKDNNSSNCRFPPANVKTKVEGNTNSHPVIMGNVATMGTPVPIQNDETLVDGQIANIDEVRQQVKKNRR